MKQKYIIVLILADGSELVVDELFENKEEARGVISDYYSIRKVRSHAGTWQSVCGYELAVTIEGRIFKRRKEHED